MAPEHLHPKTYWEKRCALAEEAVQQLARLLAAYVLPPAAQEDLARWASDWNRLGGKLNAEHPPEPNVGGNPRERSAAK